MQPTFTTDMPKKTEALCLLVSETKHLSDAMKSLDTETGGMIRTALEGKRYNFGRFQGKTKEKLVLTAPVTAPFQYIVLIGVGAVDSLTVHDYEAVGGRIYAALLGLKVTQAAVLIAMEKEATIPAHCQAAYLAHGAGLRSFNFDKYHTKKKEEEKPKLEALLFVLGDATKATTVYQPLQAEQAGIFFARECVSEPPNVLYPESMAERCKALKKEGLEVEVLGLKQMQKLGMGALLGVAQGSVREPQLVILKWMGDPKGKKEAPIAFIGKGVTFDTGGISIKPANGMEDMKYDMAGSAVVAGLMRTLALRKAPVNAIGIMGMVENMPDGNAQRPSDVVTSLSGQTIEVLNTDAEGRLVLADALWYCQDRFKPKWMVDLATLTGAMVVALGTEYAGVFSNDEPLCEALLKAGTTTGEKLWRFPLADAYDKQINSDIADVQNLGSEKGAGSITAAQFLKRFVNDVPWAHLDIAGVAWAKKAADLHDKGATAYGIRLLNALVQDYY